jgi:hypothetical protein
MASFNNSIVIRNKNSMKGSERVIAETGKLIETLKKVGVIPTKKSRRVRQTALADAQLEGMPLQGLLPTLPRATFPSQQLDFNAQRLEDIQRGAAQALALYRGQQEPDADVGDRFGVMNQGIDTDDKATQIDVNEFQPRFGANKPQGQNLDFDVPKADIFFGEGQGDEVAGTVERKGDFPVPVAVPTATAKARKERSDKGKPRKAAAFEEGLRAGFQGAREMSGFSTSETEAEGRAQRLTTKKNP